MTKHGAEGITADDVSFRVHGGELAYAHACYLKAMRLMIFAPSAERLSTTIDHGFDQCSNS